MKSKALIFVLILASFTSIAQEKSNYSKYTFNLKDLYDSQCFSTEYYDGKAWLFIMGPHYVYYTPMPIDSDGHIDDLNAFTSFDAEVPNWHWLKLNTVVFNQKLYVFYFNDVNPSPDGCLYYSRINTNSHHDVQQASELHISPNYQLKMSSVAANDTLYLFFAEKTSKHIQYIKGVSIPNDDKIHWLSDTPITMLDSTGVPLVSYGNVAACTYDTPDNKQRIMLVYPSDKISDTQNELVFYDGIGDKFLFHHKIPSSANTSGDNSAFEVSLMQGTLKGGWTKRYMMQTVYSTIGMGIKDYENIKMSRNEFDLTTGESGGWEDFDQWTMPIPMTPTLMEYYVPDGNTKQIRKYMYVLYNDDWEADVQVLQWESDLLDLKGSVTEIAPQSVMDDLWELIAVVEGPPPFVLNGHTITDLWNSGLYPPSSFLYGQQSDQTVTSSTTYTKSIEASGGFGPVSGGFKRAMQHSNSNTDETSVSVVTEIKPPLAAADSSGLMVSFYVAPSLERSQWHLLDFNGDTMINCHHNLFLFNFTSPQLKPVTESFELFSKSPRLNEIYSYSGRNVSYFPGVQTLIQTELLEDIGGGVTQTQSIQFDTHSTKSTENSRSITLGIDLEASIFHLSAGYEVELQFDREQTTEMQHDFELTYNNPAPVVPEDTSNVLSYNTMAYLMKTTDSSAYYLKQGFKNARPLFVTWEVNSIQHGMFLHGIDEHGFITKYQFSNYPNPCSEFSTFKYKLSQNAEVQLTIYNITGQVEKKLVNTTQPPGQQTVHFHSADIPNGMYFYRLLIDRDEIAGKLIVNH